MIATPQQAPLAGMDTVQIAPRADLSVESFGLSDTGRKRPANEDRFMIARLNKSLCIQQSNLGPSPNRGYNEVAHLFVVADGMGGEAAGEVASSLAVETLEAFMVDTVKWFLHADGREGSVLASELRHVLEQTDARLVAQAEQRPELRGMGTTLTMALVHGDECLVAHVGDSRGYLVRDGRAYRLTHDHTVSQEMVRQGVLSRDEAANHPGNHVLTNVVGGRQPGVRVELVKTGLAPGDRLVLCSDGLTDNLSDADIAAVLDERPGPRDACEELVRLSNERRGHDNITAVVVRVG
jgi:protein phosphatase